MCRTAVSRSISVAALSVVVLCAGCTKPQPAHPDRWARAWIDSLNSRRLQQVAALFTPDATYEDPLSGGERSGPTLAFLFAFAFYGFPNAHYELGRVTADKDRLAVEWKATGLSRVRNQPPVSGVFIIQLQGDAIASVRGYFDASGLH